MFLLTGPSVWDLLCGGGLKEVTDEAGSAERTDLSESCSGALGLAA